MATYTLISSNVLSSSAASVTFSSIPQSYTDLVIRGSSRSATAGSNGEIVLTLNGSTASTYSNTKMYGADTTAGSNRESNSARIEMFVNAASGSTTNVFSSHEIYIPSYTSSTNKPLSVSSALVQNNVDGTSYLAEVAGLRSNTAAITSVTITPTDGFVSGSSFYLYGISNA